MAALPRAPGPGLHAGPRADLQVRLLRLRAADPQQAGRGARRIEDALRCASLPGRGAALLLVRRLALGRIAAEASTQTLALRIEAGLRGVRHWQHGDTAGDDPQAEAVWFADRAQALAVLALRLAEHLPVQAWYWRRMLPSPPPGAAQGPTLAATLQALAREAAAPVALPALIEVLLRRVGRRALLALFPPPAAAALLRDAGIAAADGAAAGRTDVPGHTATGSDWIAALQAHAGGTPPRGVAGHAAEDAVPTVTMPATAELPKARATTAPQAEPVHPHAEQAPPAAGCAPLAFDTTQPTQAGGALFLLPVLARLGYADHGSPALTARVIARALERLQVPEDDPLRALWAPPRSMADPGNAATDAATDALATPWLDACRHALRRRFGIGLASLVLRPAGVAVTRSHVDVHFALAATDLRVRRHGLDLDPGWLPWFGRVVAFHFDR